MRLNLWFLVTAISLRVRSWSSTWRSFRGRRARAPQLRASPWLLVLHWKNYLFCSLDIGSCLESFYVMFAEHMAGCFFFPQNETTLVWWPENGLCTLDIVSFYMYFCRLVNNFDISSVSWPWYFAADASVNCRGIFCCDLLHRWIRWCHWPELCRCNMRLDFV